MGPRRPLVPFAVALLAACGGSGGAHDGGGSAHDGGGTTDLGAVDAGATDGGAGDAGATDGGAGDAGSALHAGTIVPLYTDPSDPTWSRLAAAAAAHPGATVVAVINPNDGPTATADPAYTSGIASLRASGASVIGYVATGYATRPESAVSAAVDLYYAEYPTLDGIFFDEAATYEPGHESLYAAEAAHARAAGATFLVANPGTTPLDAYAADFDVQLVYESAGVPTPAALAAFAGTRTHCGIIPYAVATLDPAYVPSVRADVAYVYVTDDDLPNPWDTLPTYFEALLGALE